jgi:hypothetical protein
MYISLTIVLVSAGILQTAKIALTDGIAVAPVYPIPQIIAIPDTTVMVVQPKKTGSHVQRDTSALVVTDRKNVLLVFTKTNLLCLIANHASLDISAKIYLLQTIQVTNAQLATTVLGRRNLLHSFLALLVNSTI